MPRRQSEIDEDLHSRQLAVYGRSAMRRMALAHVLIVGANGLGVEAGARPQLPCSVPWDWLGQPACQPGSHQTRQRARCAQLQPWAPIRMGVQCSLRRPALAALLRSARRKH